MGCEAGHSQLRQPRINRCIGMNPARYQGDPSLLFYLVSSNDSRNQSLLQGTHCKTIHSVISYCNVIYTQWFISIYASGSFSSSAPASSAALSAGGSWRRDDRDSFG